MADWRARLCAACLALNATCSNVQAQEPSPGDPTIAQEEADLLEELSLEDLALELAPALPSWTRLYTLRAGAGYKNNVLLSKFNRQESFFAQSGLEFFAARRPDEHGEVTVFVSLEDRRYLENVDIDSEQLFFGQVRYQKDLEEILRFSFPAEYVYQHQLVDVSVREAQFDIIEVRGHAIILSPGLRLVSLEPWWVEMHMVVHRQFLDSPLDDYWELGPRLRAGRAYGHNQGSEFHLGYEMGTRTYDHDEALTRTGQVIEGSSRALIRHEFQGEWRHVWDAKRRWRTTTRLSFLPNRDNASGYFDYDRYMATHQWRYRREPWTLLGEVRFYHYRYLHQTAGINNFKKRTRTELHFRARAERKLFRGLHAYAEYWREQIDSNISSDEYDVDTVMAGLYWDF